MRISDWSSDVCSSDLRGRGRERQHRRAAVPGNSRIAHLRGSERGPEGRYRSRHNRRSKGVTMKILQPAGWSRPKGYSNANEARGRTSYVAGLIGWNAEEKFVAKEDRTSAVQGKNVSVREENGGRRSINKK